MPLHLSSRRPSINQELCDAIAAMSSKYAGDWHVSLINSPVNEVVEVKLRSPNGASKSENIPTERVNGGSVQEAVRRLGEALQEVA